MQLATDQPKKGRNNDKLGNEESKIARQREREKIKDMEKMKKNG